MSLSEFCLTSLPSDTLLVGVDEVGCGPLCGPVVSAAVILPENHNIAGLNDSKKLTDRRREALYPQIIEKALSFCIAEASPAEIDELNIYHATMLAMRRAVKGLDRQPGFALVDGNRMPDLDIPTQTIIKGDTKVPQIMAASILAKVFRDRQMIELDRRYPGYGLAKHKGYPTKAHLIALQEKGIPDLSLYRHSFKPVKALASS